MKVTEILGMGVGVVVCLMSAACSPAGDGGKGAGGSGSASSSGTESGHGGEGGSLSCPEGQEAFRGACVDPVARYEPEERLDHDNVMAFGDPLTQLQLPDPPKSGFRIIAPPRTMKAGEEEEFCLSWPYPQFQNHIVYGARLYTTSGLHHSNVIAKPIDAKTGPNPYPGCNPGADDPASGLPSIIPDVLFANSTQVVGQETLAFPVGKGYRIDSSREISTSMHLLNTTGDDQIVEVAYDFFTMPDADLVDEVAPFFAQVNDFLIPAHSQGTVGATCDVYGGNIVEMMPHTHKLATAFDVDLLDAAGNARRVMQNGAFDAQSHIQIYDPALDLDKDPTYKLRFTCQFDNITDQDVTYGIGNNEMCILFGYIYPVKNQFVAYSTYQGQPCESVEIGLFR